MEIVSALESFDGKRTVVLEQLNDQLPRTERVMAELLAVAEHDEDRFQVGATWILKKWSDEGEPLVAKSVATFVRILKQAVCWEVRLHLLQMLVSLDIPKRSQSALLKKLRDLLSDQNKLIRAWAVSVWVAIADQNEILRQEAIERLEQLEVDEAASVRARVRQLRKKYRWTQASGTTEA